MADDIPRLTIRVYRVSASGAVVEDRGTVHVRDIKEPLLTGEWPPCRCPRHRAAS
ncbi:hypothetical protein [Streptomyces sp. NPDC048192]|uniref:hypothetical protein n=1 Tax=Streptomyces sp. NPDC048192 TaxID=3365510 RepID=UPI00371E10FE